MAVAVIAFLLVLAVIASERLHRTKVALLGAAIVVLFVGGFGQELAIESVDFNTIGLLAGMMILVYLTQQTGVYDYIAIRAGQISKGRPLCVVLSLAGTTALLSAFLDNLTTILLVVPVTFLLADALDIDPIPLIVIEVIASNIGGTATLIGDPPNIIIAGATDLSFNDFIVNLAPIVIVTFAVVIPAPLPLLPAAAADRGEEPQARDGARRARPRSATPTSCGGPARCSLLTILAFFAHQALHIEPATVALTGAAVGLLVTRSTSSRRCRRSSGRRCSSSSRLFVMVGALEATGAIDEVADAVKDVTGGDRTAELIGITLDRRHRLGGRRQHPLHDRDDPGRRASSGTATQTTTPTGGRSRSAPASAATRRDRGAANVAAAGLAERAGMPIGFVAFLKRRPARDAVSIADRDRLRALRYVASRRSRCRTRSSKRSLRGRAAARRRADRLGGAQGDRLRPARAARRRGGRQLRRDLRRARVHDRALPRLRRRARLGAR